MKCKKLSFLLFCTFILIATCTQLILAQNVQNDEKEVSADFFSETVIQTDNSFVTNQETTLKAENVPQLIGYNEAINMGHTQRLYEKESINSAVFKNKDGTESLYYYDYPIKYIDDNGSIQDVKLDIIEVESNPGTFTTKQNNIKTVFSHKLLDGISLSYDDISIRMVPLNASVESIATMRDERTIVYSYDEKTSIECSLTYTGFNSHFVVKEYTGQTEYQFKLYTNGLKILKIGESYYLTDEKENILVNFGDAFVTTADNKNNTFADLTYKQLKNNEEYLFTIHLNSEYLSNKNVQYPLKIALSSEINYNGSIQDITINSLRGSDGNSGSLFVGRRDTYGISRTLMSFPYLDLSGINYMNITNAVVRIRDLMCESTPMEIECRPFMGNAWDESSANWSNVNPDLYGIVMSTEIISYSNGLSKEHWYAFDIQPAVRGWIVGQYSRQRGILFKAPATVENGSSYNAKTFASYNRSEYKPSLYIEYISDVEPTTIGLSFTSKTAEAGTSFQLIATVLPSNASDKSVSWSSSNTNIASVNSVGQVTCKSPGIVTITAKTVNNKIATCVVTVTEETIGLQSGEIYYISNVYYDRCLDVVMGYDDNYTEVIGHPFNAQDNQKWQLELCGDNLYKLRACSSTTNKILNVTNDQVNIFDDMNQTYQKFTIVRQETLLYAKSGVYYIKYNDKFLTISPDTQTLTLTSTADALNGRSLWSFEKVEKGNADIYNFNDFTIKVPEQWYENKINQMGYQSYYFVDSSRAVALNNLKYASMYFHTGHGSEGQIAFSDINISASDIDMLLENELAGLRCFITLGCSSGATDPNGKNIIKSVYDRGAQFSLGFTHTQYTPVAETWLMRFIDYSSQGYDVRASLQYADLVANIPHFGTGMKYYWGDHDQHLSR